MTLSHGSVNECRKVQVGCTLIEMQPEQFSRKGKSAERNGKTDYHIIADMASAILCNGSEECLIPPLRRELCNYLLHGAGSHGVLGVRAPADADCNGLSTKQRCYSRKAGSGRLARSRLLRLDIIREMVATEERREYPDRVRCPHGLFDRNNSGGIALRLDGHE